MLRKPSLAKPSLAKPLLAKPLLAKPLLAKPLLAKPLLARWRFFAATFGVSVLLGATALSAPPAHANDIFGMTVGMRGGGGGQLLLGPTDLPVETQAIGIWTSSPGGGWNYQVSWFTELRFVKYLGLEFGLGLNRRWLVEDTDWEYRFTSTGPSGTEGDVVFAKSHEEINWAGLTVPIMLKGVLPLEGARIWLGVGPEWFFGQWSRGDFKLNSDTSNHPPIANGPFSDAAKFTAPVNVLACRNPGATEATARDCTRRDAISARSVDDLYLTWALGVDVDLGDLVIPIALKFGYNLDNPSAYKDRVTPNFVNPNETDAVPTSLTLRAADSLYGQLLIGIAYDVF